MTDKPVKEIPSVMSKIDTKTGEVTHEPMSWKVLPPPKSHCQFCAQKHEPELPHNAQSLYYQLSFHGMAGRSPTWADALAHCTEEIKKEWEHILRDLGHWSEPPDGEKPIKHHGCG
jgi:hypothetical protein